MKYCTLSKYQLLFIFFRHEVPVSSEEIKIVHIDDDLVVVNKPASIPVRFSYSTILLLLPEAAFVSGKPTIVS